MFFLIRLDKLNRFENVNKSKLAFCSSDCKTKLQDGKLKCNCGDDIKIYDWLWNNQNISNNVIIDNDLDVTFHPVFSSGTAFVRGDKPFRKNMHYYWEIKISSKLYGTDVMVGVGTDKITDCKLKFCSMLGIDDESWGYSYNGFIQHNKLTRKYGKQFGLGCIIGVHLDMYNGKLEYYFNRKPLGLAFDNLKNRELYPMVCSTAALSSIKLICSISQEQTLQMMCLKCVQQHPTLFQKYTEIPGLYNFYQRKYFWMSPTENENYNNNKEEEDEDLHLMTINNSKRNKRVIADQIWSKQNKKNSRRRTEESGASSSFQHFEESNCDDENVCDIVYKCLSDSDCEEIKESSVILSSEDESEFLLA